MSYVIFVYIIETLDEQGSLKHSTIERQVRKPR